MQLARRSLSFSASMETNGGEVGVAKPARFPRIETFKSFQNDFKNRGNHGQHR